jgi:ATP-dependent DNA helicase RecG
VTPETPLVRALGAKTGTPLAKHLGLETVGDLLRHYPRRYVERGELTPLKDLQVGEHVTVMARVRSATHRTVRPGLALAELVVTDGTGELRLTFFYKNEGAATWRTEENPPGSVGLFSGIVSVFNARRQLDHPDVLEPDDSRVVPIYPASTKLDSSKIKKAVQVVLQTVDLGPDPLPAELRDRLHLAPLATALRQVHRPEELADVHRARQRLKWDEAFVLQAFLAQRRHEIAQAGGTPRPGRAGGLVTAFDARLPFALTDGQREIGELLSRELDQPHPMHRLLQGEVGSGKTVVALRAMLQVVDSGGQAALLAPTEVLAQQHARSLGSLLGDLATAGELGSPEVATRLALLTGSTTAAGRRAVLAELASGEAGIVVGTHALLELGVDFHDLGLVVVDEQHRFGVEQRDALRAKGATPHVLVMTATPIPRTVAITVYGDLEVSSLRELPKGRSPLQTHVVPIGSPAYARTWERVREEVAAGRQAFVVCPRIGDAGQGDTTEQEQSAEDEGRRPGMAVTDVLPMLAGGPLQGLAVEALHGRMSPEAKDDVMTRFTRGEVQVLVATTVVEVGVDVPNATVMVVLDADRFGISQLHQLRGRVGRGVHPGLCLLATEVDKDSPAGERLLAVAATNDGFELARVDLEQRREGDVLGVRQSGGRSSLRMLNVLRDEDVILEARAEATALVEQDPDLAQHPALRQAVTAILAAEQAAYLEKT